LFERGYRRHLEADLVKWVAGGVVSGDAAQSIRKARFGEEAVSRLPAIFAMLGALMLAASVSAFVAANWQEIPRSVRLVGILTIIAGCFFPALLLERRGMPRGADAAVTSLRFASAPSCSARGYSEAARRRGLRSCLSTHAICFAATMSFSIIVSARLMCRRT
jgi:hypothetical protein